MKRQVIAIDQGPPERRQHHRIVIERGANMKARLRIVDQTELDRLLHERKISLDQHSAGEHLYRDVHAAGYIPACKWAMDSDIRGGVQTVSDHRSGTLIKIGLARAWMLSKAGRRITDYLFGVVLGERKVSDAQVPVIKVGLDKYQSFESWWYGRSGTDPLPILLQDLPARARSQFR